jgi:hypothetical protein
MTAAQISPSLWHGLFRTGIAASHAQGEPAPSMNGHWTLEADIDRCKRQLLEVRNPASTTRLLARLALLEHRLETLKAVDRS